MKHTFTSCAATLALLLTLALPSALKAGVDGGEIAAHLEGGLWHVAYDRPAWASFDDGELTPLFTVWRYANDPDAGGMPWRKDTLPVGDTLRLDGACLWTVRAWTVFEGGYPAGCNTLWLATPETPALSADLSPAANSGTFTLFIEGNASRYVVNGLGIPFYAVFNQPGQYEITLPAGWCPPGVYGLVVRAHYPGNPCTAQRRTVLRFAVVH